MRKPKSEIEFETPTVEYETPVRGTPRSDTFDSGRCWCGKKVPGCTGNPTKVMTLDAVTTVYFCPNGRDSTQPDVKLFEAAKRAGLVS